MRYGSVCSGIEAATMAWHGLGWEPAFFSEIDSFPRSVLAHHYPDVPLHDDFTTIKQGEYGAIDLLVGGTPCQSFSIAGLRGGMDDDRGNLALEFIKLAQRERPQWVVWENVPGVLSSNGGRDFGSFLGALVEIGYGFAYRVLDAQYFGVAQRRRRVFVVGYLGDWRPAAAVLFERESLSGNPAPSRAEKEKVAATSGERLTVSSGHGWWREAGDVAQTLRAQDSINKADTLYVATACNEVAPAVTTGPPFSRTGNERVECEAILPVQVAHTLRGEGFDASEDGTGRGTPLVPMVGPLTAGMGKGPRGTEAVESNHILPVTFAGNKQSDVAATLETTCHDYSRADGFNTVAFPSNANADAMGALGYDVSPSMLAGGDPPAVAYAPDTANCLSASPSSNRSPNVASGQGDVVAFAENQRAECYEMNVTNSLSGGGGKPGQGYQAIREGMAVRRLTPTECERLQGFPDGFTQIPYRNKPAEKCPDGPRYKALGNSMAVPVMKWIGERITTVEGIIG